MKSSISSSLLFLALAAAAAPVQAAEFAILIHESPEALALRTRDDEAGKAYWAAFAAYGADLAQAGVLRGGMPLTPVRATAVNGRPLGGFFIIDVADQAAADAWARRAPATDGRALAVPSAASSAMAMPAGPASKP
jgi:hypothetical protein